jgi:tetratricopeptide (TPR) repeat protein
VGLELIIAIVATIALILPAFERLILTKEEASVSKLRRTTVFGIVLAALALNISLNWAQYANVKFAALKRQKALERELALNAYALSKRNEQSLKDLASSGTTSINSFITGYYQFQRGEDVLAARKFRDSIRRGEFVAAASYLLAAIDLRNDNDLEDAKKDVQVGLDYDPDFSSLYLIRAMILAKQHERGAALKDLITAVRLLPAHCETIFEANSEPTHELYVLHNEKDFQVMLNNCAAEMQQESSIARMK